MTEINIKNYEIDFPFVRHEEEPEDYDPSAIDYDDFDFDWSKPKYWELKKDKRFKFKIWHYKGIPMPNLNSVYEIVATDIWNSCGDGRDYLSAIENLVGRCFEQIKESKSQDSICQCTCSSKI